MKDWSFIDLGEKDKNHLLVAVCKFVEQTCSKKDGVWIYLSFGTFGNSVIKAMFIIYM